MGEEGAAGIKGEDSEERSAASSNCLRKMISARVMTLGPSMPKGAVEHAAHNLPLLSRRFISY